jgi:hypothetical protein
MRSLRHRVNLHGLPAKIGLSEKIQIALGNRPHQGVGLFDPDVGLDNRSVARDDFVLYVFSFKYAFDNFLLARQSRRSLVPSH